uniref:LNS2/PITP domain-containing protein n=1 Tax=Capra hircus TaxID=9925 RepID=A0A8C2QYR8_CAPHI
MYGPLDMVTLTGEKVDVHIMMQPPSGEWLYLDTLVTNSSGRVSYTIPETHRLGVGVYPIKMVVRGDHTFADSYITVLPKGTEFVVFSIDGSFAASVSIMGSDPKVRAGAVDVVRHWQDLGYLIIYVTGRPDMQKQRVVAWLAQHNFPHGVVSFCDGLVHDPLRHKANFLKLLISEVGPRVERSGVGVGVGAEGLSLPWRFITISYGHRLMDMHENSTFAHPRPAASQKAPGRRILPLPPAPSGAQFSCGPGAISALGTGQAARSVGEAKWLLRSLAWGCGAWTGLASSPRLPSAKAPRLGPPFRVSTPFYFSNLISMRFF